MNPSQMIFNFFCPDLSEESLSMTLKPYRRYFLNNETWKVRLLLDPRAAEWILYCWVGRQENNINLIVRPHQSSWATRCIVNAQ